MSAIKTESVQQWSTVYVKRRVFKHQYGSREKPSSYGTLIGNRLQSIEWCYFQ